MQILDIDRIVIATPDLHRTTDHLNNVLDLAFGDSIQAEVGLQVELNYSHPGIEVITPRTNDDPIAEFIEHKGPGLYGVVFRVADIEAAKAELAESGIDPIEEGEFEHGTEVFYRPKDFDGMLLALIEYDHPLETLR